MPVIPNYATYQEWSHSQTNVRCEVSEDDQVKHLLQVLGKTSEDLCAHFPALCNAHRTHQPLTVHNIREAELLSFERYERLSQHAVQQVGNALV